MSHRDIQTFENNGHIHHYFLVFGYPGETLALVVHILLTNWANENRMVLNLDKTWEMVLKGNTSKLVPDPLPSINRRDWLNVLGVLFQKTLVIGT